MLDPMVGHLQVLGNRCWGGSQRWASSGQPVPPFLILLISAPRRGVSSPPPPAVSAPLQARPRPVPSPVTACLPLTLSLPSGSSVWLPQFQPVCLSIICLPTYLPVLSPAGQSTLPLSTWFLSQPVMLPHLSPSGPSVPGRRRLTWLLTVFVPAHSVSWLREGDEEATGWSTL